jgi:hypothetical protein
MQVLSLALSIDSLIASIALAGVTRKRHFVPLVVLFGVCDGFASFVTPSIGGVVVTSGVGAPVFLIVWGALIMLNAPAIHRLSGSAFWAYLLPVALAIDNLLVAQPNWVSTGVTSGAMAAAGFAIGALAWRIPILARLPRRWIGAPLAIAGSLLLSF